MSGVEHDARTMVENQLIILPFISFDLILSRIKHIKYFVLNDSIYV